MKNCTKHSIERWVERIVGIVDERERAEYIRANSEQIKEHMNKTLDYSKFIYKGQIGDNITRHYYIKDDIIFVLNTTDDAIVTVYKIDFGFPRELNLQVAKGLTKEIARLLEEKEKIDMEILEEMDKLKHEVELLNEQEDILRRQLKIIQEKRKFVEDSMKNVNEASRLIELEIKKYTNNLVNSKEYKDDLKMI